jgi:hypothetical protein
LYSPTGRPQPFVENARNIPRCHHIRVDGRQCGSPSLRGKRLCYFHSRFRVPRSLKGLPMLEDPNSIQLVLMQIMRGLIEKSFDPKTAGLLFYGLQIAMVNGRRVDFQPFSWQVIRDLHSAIPADATDEEAAVAAKQADKLEREIVAEREREARAAARAARRAQAAPKKKPQPARETDLGLETQPQGPSTRAGFVSPALAQDDNAKNRAQ